MITFGVLKEAGNDSACMDDMFDFCDVVHYGSFLYAEENGPGINRKENTSIK